MKNLGKLFWGLGFILVGAIMALNQLELTNINIFFKGWWTLFIIIPSLIDLIYKKGESLLSLIALFIGIIFLLTARNFISYDILSALLLPVILILIGLSILFNNFIKNKVTEKFIESNDENFELISAVFSENKTILETGKKFKNTKIDVVFGGAVLDLRKADLNHENHIKSSAIFGGIKILIPDGCNAVLKSTNIFGSSVSKIVNSESNKKTIYIESFVLFGGTEIL